MKKKVLLNNQLKSNKNSFLPKYAWYLYLTIIHSLLSLLVLTAIIFFPIFAIGVATIYSIFPYVWLIISIGILLICIKDKFSLKYYIIPTLSIIDFIFSLILGLVIAFIAILNGATNWAEIINASTDPFLNIFGGIIPAITLFIAIWLIIKK
jgi:hypothetical protein